MSRLVPAAAQLIEQVTRLNHNAKAKAVDPPDGFGRHRSIEFDARTSKWLAEALNAINDPRIDYVQYEGKGKAIVNFVPDTRADHRTVYPLESVLRVLKGEE